MTTATLPPEAAALPDPVPMTTLVGPPIRGAMAAVLGAIKTTLAVSGAVAPGAAADWCHKRYFTPNRAPLRDSDRELLGKAEALKLPWKSPKGAPYPIEGELHGWRWGSGPVVVLVHGWDSRAARIAAPLVKPLTDAGFQVVAFDMPGHGASPGLQTDLLSFIAAIKQVVESVGGNPHAIIAHSMGAVSAVGALAEGVTPTRYIGVGSAVWLRTFPERFHKILGVGGRLRERMMDRLYETFAPAEWERRSAHVLAAQLKIPALLFHCKDDIDTSWTGSVALARAWDGSRLELVSKLGHYRILGDAGVQSKMIDFLKS